ncbi:hypothetical protein FRC17_004025 [Serendipita sp. 399]|nr:hypothetical protein FRC17_004025 [Serendipita sp. 399]
MSTQSRRNAKTTNSNSRDTSTSTQRGRREPNESPSTDRRLVSRTGQNGRVPVALDSSLSDDEVGPNPVDNSLRDPFRGGTAIMEEENSLLRRRLERLENRYEEQSNELRAYQESSVREEEATRRQRTRESDNEDENEPVHKKLRATSNAYKAGKKFVALYCAYADPDIIFDVDVDDEADSGDAAPRGDDTHQDDNADLSVEDDQPPRPFVLVPDATCNVSTEAGREAFIRAKVKLFYKEALNTEKRDWGTAEYVKDFNSGMSKMRSSIKQTIGEKISDLFGFNFNDKEHKDFADLRRRKYMPKVEKLLENKLLSCEDKPDGSVYQTAFRHPCLIKVHYSKVLLRILHGPASISTGKKAQMARTTYARPWRIKSVNAELIIFAATLARINHVLTGESSISDSQTQDYYWSKLHLMRVWVSTGSSTVFDLFNTLNKAVDFGKEDEVDRAHDAVDEDFLANIPS